MYLVTRKPRSLSFAADLQENVYRAPDKFGGRSVCLLFRLVVVHISDAAVHLGLSENSGEEMAVIEWLHVAV